MKQFGDMNSKSYWFLEKFALKKFASENCLLKDSSPQEKTTPKTKSAKSTSRLFHCVFYSFFCSENKPLKMACFVK